MPSTKWVIFFLSITGEKAVDALLFFESGGDKVVPVESLR
jgi:hypothetical protein